MATIEERREMRKMQPSEHAYTGYVPAEIREPQIEAPKIKNPPILGYSGYRPGCTELIGTTKTRDVKVRGQPERHERRPGSPAMSEKSGYGMFDAESGYGQFMAPPSEADCNSEMPAAFKYDENLNDLYERSIAAVGGEKAVTKLIKTVRDTIEMRSKGRADTFQRMKRAFLHVVPSETEPVPLSKFEEVLALLSCVLSDDQIVAIFGTIDTHCSGKIDRNAFITKINPN